MLIQIFQAKYQGLRTSLESLKNPRLRFRRICVQCHHHHLHSPQIGLEWIEWKSDQSNGLGYRHVSLNSLDK